MPMCGDSMEPDSGSNTSTMLICLRKLSEERMPNTICVHPEEDEDQRRENLQQEKETNWQ